jgi:hypothetical protein
VHDTTGPLGTFLRHVNPIQPSSFDVDDATFMTAFVSLFMQIMGILQMPQFLGPAFTPFRFDLILEQFQTAVAFFFARSSTSPTSVVAMQSDENGVAHVVAQDSKTRNRRKHKKSKIKQT